MLLIFRAILKVTLDSEKYLQSRISGFIYLLSIIYYYAARRVCSTTGTCSEYANFWANKRGQCCSE